MPSFSKSSKDRLATCHPDLQALMNEVIKHIDISILGGHRSVEEQAEIYRRGMSKLSGAPGQLSKHNHSPSLAVDFSPYPIDWQSRERFIAASYFAKGIATQMGIKVRLGCDWNADLVFSEGFFDGPHLELVIDDE